MRCDKRYHIGRLVERAIDAVIDTAEGYGYTADDVIFTVLPLFHGNAWLVSCLPAIIAEATFAFSRRFSASTFWDEVRHHGATQFNSLGAMTNIIWAQPERPDDAANPVRQCMGQPTPEEFYHAFEKRFGLTFTTLYGLTDFGLVTHKGPDAPAEKWASTGRVRDAVEVRMPLRCAIMTRAPADLRQQIAESPRRAAAGRSPDV